MLNWLVVMKCGSRITILPPPLIGMVMSSPYSPAPNKAATTKTRMVNISSRSYAWFTSAVDQTARRTERLLRRIHVCRLAAPYLFRFFHCQVPEFLVGCIAVHFSANGPCRLKFYGNLRVQFGYSLEISRVLLGVLFLLFRHEALALGFRVCHFLSFGFSGQPLSFGLRFIGQTLSFSLHRFLFRSGLNGDSNSFSTVGNFSFARRSLSLTLCFKVNAFSGCTVDADNRVLGNHELGCDRVRMTPVYLAK